MVRVTGPRKAEGYGIIVGEWGEQEEHDTFTCSHCNGICIVKKGSGKQRGYCFRCNHPTCGREPCLTCIPFERKLEEMEARGRLRKALDRQ